MNEDTINGSVSETVNRSEGSGSGRATQFRLTQFASRTYILTTTTGDTQWQIHLSQEGVNRLHAMTGAFASNAERKA